MAFNAPVTHLDMLSFVGLERSHLRGAVYRRVFGDDVGPLRIGRYSILERVGAGARGVVFKAFDNQLDRLVALKVLSARADDHDELLREAKALARLSHPNVLPVYEVGETEEGQVFLATEYVKGWTLRGWYDEETRGEAAIIGVIRQVARGVQAAHDEGLVHRDLKPANILLGEDGRVRVADFGLARFDPSALAPVAGTPRDGLATTTAGTPGYMAPELFRGAPASAASDQYALAVTLHELLFGALPDQASSAVLRGATKTVTSAVRRGLADAPELRFATVGAFADALIIATRTPLRRRMPWLVGLSAIGAATAAVWITEPTGERQADNDLALLRARAALPDDPAAAISALSDAPDHSDPQLLATAERALALGPERARYALPEGANDIVQVGSILAFRDPKYGLRVLRTTLGGLESLDAGAVGLSTQTHDPSLPAIFQRSDSRVALDDAVALAAVDPRAARRLAAQTPGIGLSDDGRRLARATDEGRTLSVEDTSNGEVLWSVDLEGSYIRQISLDATGDRVAWAGHDGTAQIHNLSTGITSPLEPDASQVLFEPDGDSVIILGRFSGVFRIELATMETMRLLERDEGFRRVEVAPTGPWLAALSPGDEITVTNLTASVPRTIAGSAFEFSPDGKRLAVLDGEHIKVHDLASTEVQTFTSSGDVSSFDFSDERTLWVVGADGFVRRHEVASTVALTGHTASIRDLALSADGSFALSLASDFTLRRWDVETGVGHTLVELQTDPRVLSLDEGANRIALTRYGNPTMLFDLDTGAPVGEAPHSNLRPVVGPDGALFGAGKTGVWRSHDGETTTISAVLGHCVDLMATKTWVAAICREGEGNDRLYIWNGGVLSSLALAGWSQDKSSSIALSGNTAGSSMHAWPDANHIYLLSAQELWIGVTDSGAPELLGSPHVLGNVLPYALPADSSDAHDLVVRKPGGIYALWDTTEEPVFLYETDAALALAVSGDGRRVAYSTDRHQIIVRDRALSKARPTLSTALGTEAGH